MATLKKPKKLRLPKKPKATASIATMENYLKKVGEIKKMNDKRLAEFEKAKKQKIADKKKKEQLRAKISGLK